VEITATKSLITQRDLALAYSPGVAAACEAIVENPNEARNLTVRGNLVAVVTNGTAVLGLGNIGPLAAKPVMEGKGVLFKKFAGINVFDIELAENDPDKLVDIIAALEPTFGGINLEDIKAPECFYIERKLRDRMKIPVFHDDQHGTAIIVGAAVVNGLRVVNKDIGKVKLVVSGRRCRRRSLPGHARGPRREDGERLGDGHQGRRLRGPQGRDGRQQGPLCAARPMRASSPT
jgi:malate dehydrogenase (oxaloacetate-decarboxylating)(NADP+)